MTDDGSPSSESADSAIDRREIDRRSVLKYAGVASIGGLAGCSAPNSADDPPQSDADSTSSGSGSGGSSPENVTEVHVDLTSSDDEPAAELDVGEAVEHAEVSAVATDDGYAFDPQVVHVTLGGSVTWEMVDDLHSVTAYAGGDDAARRIPESADGWDSEMLSEEETFTHTFDVEGIYDYFCLPHHGMGMVGTVVVGDPDLDSQPALDSDGSELPEPARDELQRIHDSMLVDAGEESESSEGDSTDDGADSDSAADAAGSDSAGGKTCDGNDVVDATTTEISGFVDLEIAPLDDAFAVGKPGKVVARYEGARLARAPITMNGLDVGRTDGCGELSFHVPASETLLVRTRIDDATGSAAVNVDVASTEDESTGGPSRHSVQVGSNGADRFQPAVTSIEVGDTVEWEHADGTHTVTAYAAENDQPRRIPEAAESWDSGLLSEGETFSRTFDEAGVYDYFCLPHHGMGMVGSVVVGDPDPDAQPGLAAPQQQLSDAAQTELSKLNETARSDLGTGPDAGAGDPEDGGEGGDTEDGESGDAGDGEGGDAGDGEGGDAGDGGDGGSGSEGSDPGGSDGESATEVVHVSPHGDDTFDPGVATIDVGDAVEWAISNGTHTVTAYSPSNDQPQRIPESAAAWDSGLLSEGDSYTHTFDEEGVYDYFCLPHQGGGMVGSVIVGDPDPAGQPGLAAPQQRLDDDARTALSRLNDLAEQAIESDGGEEDGDAGQCDGESVVDARTLESDGTIEIAVRSVDGQLERTEEATIVARYEGARLAQAPATVEGDDVGTTDDCGRLGFTVPDDDDFRVEIRVGGGDVRGRIDVDLEGNG